MSFQTLDINMQPFDMTYDLESGFLRGTIWNNLYDKYKYEATKTNTPMTVENQLIYMIQVYSFAVTELTLFVCTHKDNIEAINMLKKISLEREKIYSYYEMKYRDLDHSSVNETYNYLEGNWPWEGETLCGNMKKY